jgi:hypothetical protein
MLLVVPIPSSLHILALGLSPPRNKSDGKPILLCWYVLLKSKFILSNESWKQPLAEMQRMAAYIRPKVVGPFPEPYVSGSYVHRAAPMRVY